MSISNMITLLGIAAILFYCLTQILQFYGFGLDIYAPYLFFYGFLMFSIIILPMDEPRS